MYRAVLRAACVQTAGGSKDGGLGAASLGYLVYLLPLSHRSGGGERYTIARMKHKTRRALECIHTHTETEVNAVCVCVCVCVCWVLFPFSALPPVSTEKWATAAHNTQLGPHLIQCITAISSLQHNVNRGPHPASSSGPHLPNPSFSSVASGEQPLSLPLTSVALISQAVQSLVSNPQ